MILSPAFLHFEHFPEAYFSQLMDPDYMVYGETVFLYDESAGGSLVEGTLLMDWKYVRFIPDKGLVPEHVYRMVVSQEMRNIDGLKLDTDLDRIPGGPDYEFTFRAIQVGRSVQNILYADPISDTDGNGYLESPEMPTERNYFEIQDPLIAGPSYAWGTMPMFVKPLTHDPDGSPRVPIEVHPGTVLFATSTEIALDILPPELREKGRIINDTMMP